jgi:hypothetical protein
MHRRFRELMVALSVMAVVAVIVFAAAFLLRP